MCADVYCVLATSLCGSDSGACGAVASQRAEIARQHHRVRRPRRGEARIVDAMSEKDGIETVKEIRAIVPNAVVFHDER